MVQLTMQEMLEAGAHFGHQTRRWNPKMREFIFGRRNGIYIIDLQRTRRQFEEAVEFVEHLARHGRRILFVGTKRQAQKAVEEEAKRCGQFYVTHRWLGGMLTNFVTIRASVERLKETEAKLADPESLATKKERLRLNRDREKMVRNLDGIRDMEQLPDAIFVVDPRKEHIAVAEANKLGVPIIAIVDTNCDPESVDYVIPGNDDAIRTIRLFASKIAEAYSKGAGIREKTVDEPETAPVSAVSETASQPAVVEDGASTDAAAEATAADSPAEDGASEASAAEPTAGSADAGSTNAVAEASEEPPEAPRSEVAEAEASASTATEEAPEEKAPEE